MAGPNRRPDKGFLKELSAKPSRDITFEPFKWDKPVVKPEKVKSMGTERRMREFKQSVPSTETNGSLELKAHQKNRRGE